jgi:hypothetical protein
MPLTFRVVRSRAIFALDGSEGAMLGRSFFIGHAQSTSHGFLGVDGGWASAVAAERLRRQIGARFPPAHPSCCSARRASLAHSMSLMAVTVGDRSRSKP